MSSKNVYYNTDCHQLFIIHCILHTGCSQDRAVANCNGSIEGLNSPNASIWTEARRVCVPGAAAITSALGYGPPPLSFVIILMPFRVVPTRTGPKCPSSFALDMRLCVVALPPS